MKKTNAGLADSPFFADTALPVGVEASLDNSATTTPRHHALMVDTMPPRHRDTTPVYENIVQVVRRAVKAFGKETATHRFTHEEKQAVNEIVYHYRQQGIKTTENQITRLALNYFLEEYRREGDKSLLAQLLRELNA